MVKSKKKLRLVLPNKKYVRTFAKGIEEARKENTEPYSSPFRSEFELFKTIKDFPLYSQNRIDQRKGKNLEKGHVPQTVYWAIVNDKFVGVLKLRHRLWKDRVASHIGYAVIPSERRKGYATEMLRLGLKKAGKLGIRKVVMGCRVNNLPSRKVIEKNGGVLIEKYVKDGIPKLKFQIDNK